MNTDAVHMVLNLPYRKRIVNLGRGRIVNREYGHIVHYRVARSTFSQHLRPEVQIRLGQSMLILLNTARIVFAQKRHAVQLKRIAKRTDMQHQFRQGQFQIRSRLNRRLIRHVIRIFLLHDRVTCLQNLARRTARNHLLDPSGLLAQTFFLFRHCRQGNLNLLIWLAGKLSLALFAKINRRRL